MIFLDGSQALGNSMRVPVVLDNLIAKHDLPAMIAIFVDPGILPVVSDADQNRYNRIYEYDSLTPRFSDFLLNELIPEVAKQYNLSKNPDDRGLSGVSTGAVGAFMAAWNRPDQFHRVLSLIGTYVAMKGADALPALVRRTEPKPIRIFMQDGTADHITPAEPYGTNFAGSWPINNQVMYEALEFAGYDAKLVMGTDGAQHEAGWRDSARCAALAVARLSRADRGARAGGCAAAGLGSVCDAFFDDLSCRQAVATDWRRLPFRSTSLDRPIRNGNVYFADPRGGTIERVDPQGKVTQFAEPTRRRLDPARRRQTTVSTLTWPFERRHHLVRHRDWCGRAIRRLSPATPLASPGSTTSWLPQNGSDLFPESLEGHDRRHRCCGPRSQSRCAGPISTKR